MITCGSVIWDYLTGWRGWSIDFVFPLVSLGSMVSILAISKLRSYPLKDNISYLLSAALYSFFIPFILLSIGRVGIIYPSLVCSSIGFMMLFELILFRWDECKEELKKKFHL